MREADDALAEVRPSEVVLGLLLVLVVLDHQRSDLPGELVDELHQLLRDLFNVLRVLDVPHEV